MLKKIGGGIWELFKFVATVLLIVVPIRLYVAQPFIVSGASMEPTFHTNEYLIIDEFSYHWRPPERGEVVVFKYPEDPSKYFIKRVIGLPNETVVIKNNEVWIKQTTEEENKLEKLEEPYLQGPQFWADARASLSDGEYFVMGDNRMVSHDSRAWGALPESLITGRAFVRLFPPARAEILPGAVK